MRWLLLPMLFALLCGAAFAESGGDPLRWTLRDRPVTREYRLREEREQWDPRRTALIICDMWDHHWCASAERRTGEVAPRMDAFARALRRRGVLVIHAPSGCVKPYEGTAARRLAQNAPRAANLPREFDRWCYSIPEEERTRYPIDQSDGGCDCKPRCATGSPWTRQIASIGVEEGDAVSDSGPEIWNLMEARGIRNVLMVGVHTNMCVLGRPFGLRNLSRAGKRVALVRDLTDTMYNPEAWPHVSHFRGTELIIEHIERHVCPTVTSSQLLGGRPFRFRGS